MGYRLVLLAVIFFLAAVLFIAKAGLTSARKVPVTLETATPAKTAPEPSGGQSSEPEPAIIASPAGETVSAPVQAIESPAAVPAREAPAKVPAKPDSPVVKPGPAIKAAPKTVSPPSASPVAAARSQGPKPEKPVPPKPKGTLIFVFDDAGHNLKQLEPFLKLPFPVTIAVLPGLEYSQRAAERARAAGKEVILHQPMQAINLSYDPGPGAIRQGMTGDEIRAVMRKNLDEVGPVSGLNNHEGSLITSDPAAMSAVLDVVQERGIYFLDSRTIAKTAAPAVAKERNMNIWERAVFLDNIQERESIIDAVNNGLKIAERKGAAIMIGHIWSSDLAEILSEMYPELLSQGFSLSTIAHIAVNDEENR